MIEERETLDKEITLFRHGDELMQKFALGREKSSLLRQLSNLNRVRQVKFGLNLCNVCYVKMCPETSFCGGKHRICFKVVD